MVSRSYTGTALERARVFDGRGFQLHYEDVGHGDTVVFLAGYLMDLHLYDAQVEGLKDRYRRMRLDRRGHGGSDLAPGPGTMDDLIEDAIALITSVAADPCHLVGMSLGGAEITPTAATSTPPQEKAAASACTCGYRPDRQSRRNGYLLDRVCRSVTAPVAGRRP